MADDFYSTLGVSKTASKADIKKAYRNLAQKHHPDKGGDEKKFKKINEAYEVLSDDQKRSQYDQFGSAGVGSNFGGGSGGGFSGGGFSSANFDFGGMEDVFSSFFGGGRSGGKRSRSTRGGDLEVELDLTFEESITGTKKTFTSRYYETCSFCNGKGGEGHKKCSVCGGTGMTAQKFQTPFGVVSQQTTCSACGGEGSSFEKICSHCHGDGRVESKQKIEVNIPAGVEDGSTLRFTGKGEAGIRGGQRGDLYIHVRVASSRTFERRGLDLIAPLKISVFDAIEGGKFEIKTFWKQMKITVPENTRDKQLLRVKGEGIKSGGRVGDHLVRIEYEMPKKISTKLKELLQKSKLES